MCEHHDHRMRDAPAIERFVEWLLPKTSELVGVANLATRCGFAAGGRLRAAPTGAVETEGWRVAKLATPTDTDVLEYRGVHTFVTRAIVLCATKKILFFSVVWGMIRENEGIPQTQRRKQYVCSAYQSREL